MRNFYLPGCAREVGSQFELPIELQRHVVKVLRYAPGAHLQLFDGAGTIAEIRLLEEGRAEIVDLDITPAPSCQLNLIQGLPKGDKLELVLQKGTELGVNHFSVVEMERSVSRMKSERSDKRSGRWRKIVQEAARQCRQPYLPKLELEQSYEQAVTQSRSDEKLLLWEEGGLSLTDVLPDSPVRSLTVIVGPEGGISPEEVRVAEGAGYKAVGLGPRILRTETAGLAIMSVLQYLYGDLAGSRRNERNVQGKG